MDNHPQDDGFNPLRNIIFLFFRQTIGTPLELVHLLTVEDSLQITGRGLVVVPLLPSPPIKSGFKPFRRTVRVERPDGVMLEREALFALEHFSLIGGGSKWGIVVMFPSASKPEVPVGSRIAVDAETLAALPAKE